MNPSTDMAKMTFTAPALSGGRRAHTPLRRLAPLLLWVLLACIATPHAGAGEAVRLPPFQRVQLDNGAVLLLMERHDVPLLEFTALLRGGALSDPADQLGLSSLLAGMLEKGAGQRSARRFAETLASVGGVIETAADTESISVHGSFLASDSKLMVELLADMLQRPQLQATEFDALRARRVELIRAAKGSDLAALMPIYGAASLFGEHPYGRPVSGSEASLARIEHAALLDHYQQHVGADRLMIAVAGDFKTAQMRQLLSRAFSGWRRAPAALPQPPAAAPPVRPHVLLIDAPDSVQSYFWAGTLGVRKADPDRAALDIVNTVFGGRFTSMLNSELRVRTGLSYGARSSLQRLAGGGSWSMSSFTRTQTTVQAIDLALATLEKLHTAALDPAQLDSGRSYVLGGFPLQLETAAQWAYQLATLEFYGLDRSYIDGYSSALAQVTPQRAREVIDRVFPSPRQLVLVVIGNAEAIREGLRKYGPLVQMKLSDPFFTPPR